MVFHLGKNYFIDRDSRGRYRHSYVFMKGATVKLLNHDELLKGKISTIEEYYCVLDMEGNGNLYQVTVNFSEVNYIRYEEFPTVSERSSKFSWAYSWYRSDFFKVNLVMWIHTRAIAPNCWFGGNIKGQGAFGLTGSYVIHDNRCSSS